PTPQSLLVRIVTPLVAVGALAVLVRSLIAGTVLPGVVLGIGTLALQIGAWLGLALVMPAIAHQFHAEVSDRHSFAIATYASVPLWIAGLLYIVPEDPWFIFIWSRALVLLIALLGLVLLRRSFSSLGVERKIRTPLAIATGGAYFTLYVFLSIVFGVVSNIFFMLTTPA
ncbi:MAG: hypothetical protein V3T05_03745, partial [Myxococcota bacterium]